MTTLTNFRGLQVLSPYPSGSGGSVIQDSFEALVGWHPKTNWNSTAVPGSGDDDSQNYFSGSLWSTTNVTPTRIFCKRNNTGSAIWDELLVTPSLYPLLGGRSGGQTLIGGTGSGDSLTLSSTSHATKGKVIIAPGGDLVGIGTSSPATNLDVRGTNAHIQVGTSTTSILGSTQTGFGASNGTEQILFGAQTGLGFFGTISATKLGFVTQNSTKMTLDTSGNLGLGVTTPAAALHFGGNATITVQPASPAASFLDLTSVATGGVGYGGNGAGIRLESNGTSFAEGWIRFSTTLSGVGAAERMTITNAGKVGIGNTSPNTTLHVNGGLSLKVASKSAAYTLTTSDFCVLVTTGATANMALTLPAATNTGMVVQVKKIDGGAGSVNITAAGSDTIEGAATLNLPLQNSSALLIADGTSKWYRVASI